MVILSVSDLDQLVAEKTNELKIVQREHQQMVEEFQRHQQRVQEQTTRNRSRADLITGAIQALESLRPQP